MKAKNTQSQWRSYRIGNILRGFIYFKARSTSDAWERGCKQFNRALPSSGKIGRLILLQVKTAPRPILTTRWVASQVAMVAKKRAFSNLTELPIAEDWIDLAYGASKQKLFNPHRITQLTMSTQ